MSLFSDLFNPSKKSDQAAQNIQAGIATGRSEALPYMQTGLNAIQQYYGQAAQPYSQVFTQASSGAGLYADLTGANGPEGQARAAAAFTTDPGYEFAKNQALQATQRAQGTGGWQGSGNVLDALEKQASGYASQQYGQWAQRLAPYLGQQSQAASGLAGVYTGQAQDTASQNNAIGNFLYGTDTGAANATAAALLGTQANENQLGSGILNFAGKLLGAKGNTFNFGGGTGGGGAGGTAAAGGTGDIASIAGGDAAAGGDLLAFA
jgi:hypothetical protein